MEGSMSHSYQQNKTYLDFGYAVVKKGVDRETLYQSGITLFGWPRSAWLRKTEQEAWDWIADKTDKYTVEYVTTKCECFGIKERKSID